MLHTTKYMCIKYYDRLDTVVLPNFPDTPNEGSSLFNLALQ